MYESTSPCKQDVFSLCFTVLPGDPASFHEAGWISSPFTNGWVAAWAAASSTVRVRAVGAVPLSARHRKPPGVRTKWEYNLTEKRNRESGVSPGVVLSVVWGLGLAGASVSRRRVWGRPPAAPGAAALSEVGFAPCLLFLPAWCVRVSSRRCWRAPVVSLTSTGAVVALGRVSSFCPGEIGSIKEKKKRQIIFS